jgi:hypothetical protein
MAHRPAAVARFAGLDLASSPDEAGCIDMLNVDLDVRGALRSRDGFNNFTTSELTNQPDSLFGFHVLGTGKRLLVGNGNRVDALDLSAASVANTTAPTVSPHFFTRFGGPTQEAVYFANGTDQVRRFVIDTFSSPGGLSGQTGKFVAVTPTSNRLVVARESGTTGGNNPASVNFSDAGAPETFTSTNWVDLDPGDGEAIMALTTWGNYLFAFKQTKFYIFYGETVDVTGEPVFNYRKIDTGIGLVASQGVVAARDGVYFVSRTGVYRTTGGTPELVSRAIGPLFAGELSSFYQGDEIAQLYLANAAMTWHNERIYLSVTTGASTTNDRMLVFDPRYDEWLVWNIPAAALTTFRNSLEGPRLVMARPSGLNYVDEWQGYPLPAWPDDDGTAITSRYRTGFSDFGAPGAEKDIDSTRLWGTGTVAVQGSKEFGDLDTATNVTLGTSPTIDKGLHNKQKTGELISYQFGGTSAWRLHRYAHYLRGGLPPGLAD